MQGPACPAPTVPLDAGERRSPDAGGSGVARVVGEVPRLPAERPLHAVRQLGIAPVEHLLEEVDEQLDPFARNSLRIQCGGKSSTDTDT